MWQPAGFSRHRSHRYVGTVIQATGAIYSCEYVYVYCSLHSTRQLEHLPEFTCLPRKLPYAGHDTPGRALTSHAARWLLLHFHVIHGCRLWAGGWTSHNQATEPLAGCRDRVRPTARSRAGKGTQICTYTRTCMHNSKRRKLCILAVTLANAFS